MVSPKELAIAGRETRRAGSVTLDPLEMLARPGAYANRTRGARARRAAGAGQGPAAVDGEPDSLTPSQRERRRPRARLIARVFEVDPLRCACGGTRRAIAFILNPAVIRKILQHRPRIETRTHAPPAG